MKASEVSDGGLLRHNFLDYLWRHMKQGKRTLEELHALVNESFKEKGRTPMSWGTFVARVHRLDMDGHVKSVLSNGRVVFEAIGKPTDPLSE